MFYLTVGWDLTFTAGEVDVVPSYVDRVLRKRSRGTLDNVSLAEPDERSGSARLE